MAESGNEKSLRHSLKDATTYAVMMGIGETYLSAFALFLKASTPQIGLLASLPSLPNRTMPDVKMIEIKAACEKYG